MEINYYKKRRYHAHRHIRRAGEGGIEIAPNITLELDENRQIIGIEILEASKYLRDTILETAQAKLMNMEYVLKLPDLPLRPVC